MKVKKVSGEVGNGSFNATLGIRNGVPRPKDTRGMTLKNQGVTNLSTRLPYDSSKGEIRNHKGL